MDKHPITIQATINAPIDKVWEYFNSPGHITKWAFASDDWEALNPENDLQLGGKFKTTMAAKDKTQSFDFTGTYTAIKEHELIEYNMDDGRHVKTEFTKTPEGTTVTQTFDPETENPEEMQRSGWQSILDNFKKHVESS
jgi:uncharacterized protein YndB with AHSA1/START domain